MAIHIINDIASPSGIASHIPGMPNSFGSKNKQIILTTRFLTIEINVEALLLPKAINILVDKTHPEENGTENISIVKPKNAISRNS